MADREGSWWWRGFFALMLVGSVVGIWHALPMLNVVADEMYFVGGVLRALSHHSLVPLPLDVPYGTLTFYLNYVAEILFLGALALLRGGNISAVITQVTLHPEWGYLVARSVSALLAIVFLLWAERFLRREGLSPLARAAALSVPFMTVLPAAILHTSKVWVLSSLLGAAALLLLYRAWRSDNPSARTDARNSILAAAAATANFPLAGIFLLVVPLLAARFRRERATLLHLVRSSAWGALLVIGISALNYHNIVRQITDIFTQYHPLGAFAAHAAVRLTFLESLSFHVVQALGMYLPALLLIAGALLVRAVSNRLLFTFSLGAALLYLATISFVDNWTTDLAASSRYLVPLAFFFMGSVTSLAHDRLRAALIVFCIVNVAYYGFTLYLLSIPATFNQAADYVNSRYAREERLLIGNALGDLDLPRNRASALFTKDAFCGSKCAYYRSASTTDAFLPTVLGEQSDWSSVQSRAFDSFLWIDSRASALSCAGAPQWSVTSGVPDDAVVGIDRGLGNYLSPAFWSLTRLGKNIYLYEVSRPCFTALYEASKAGVL